MIVKMDQMSQVHVRKDDVQQINFNVEIKIVHRFHLFVMVEENFVVYRNYLFDLAFFKGMDDCRDNSGRI